MVSRSGLRVEGLHVDGATTAVPTTQPLTMENARGSLEDLNLTPEEVDKFQTAFKDENFKKMFAEYAKEISDPKNKAESDAYLKQLEYEGRIEKVYGKDVQLVMPKPGFVAKTFQEGEGGEGEGSDPSQNSSDSKKTKSKAFINICHSDKVEDAVSEKRPGGLQWSVPHTLGQPHEERDKQNELCVAYDFCVSEHTYGLTQSDERLKTLVVETAIEAVNRAFGKKYSMAFTLPKKTFMGPATGPGVQALKGKKGDKDGKATTTPSGRIPPITDQPKAMTKSAFSFDKAVGGKGKKTAEKTPEPEKNEHGEITPKHTIIHRDEGKDMSKQFGVGSASREAERRRDTRPNSLVLRIETPELDSMKNAELDVGDDRVFFRVKGLYALDLSLPFPVVSDDGSAKFDKKTKRLEITLPVRPVKLEPAPVFTEPKGEEAVDETVEETVVSKESTSPVDTVDTTDAPINPGAVVVESPDTTEKSQKLSSCDASEAAAAASAAAAVAAAKAFDKTGETENQKKWRQMYGSTGSDDDDRAISQTETKFETSISSDATNSEPTGTDSTLDSSVLTNTPATDKQSSVTEPKPVTATYLKPSLRGAAELGDKLD